MASIDYGVIAFKNNQLLEESKENEELHKQGAGGYFTHGLTGVTFERSVIKHKREDDTVSAFVNLHVALTHSYKKALYSNVNGLDIKSTEIFPDTFLSKFKDEQGDRYTIIHGYDVSLSHFWSKRRGKVVKKIINRTQNKEIRA